VISRWGRFARYRE